MKYTGLAYDSRKVKPGDAFVAITGLKVDGNDYVFQAIDNGAKVIVTEKDMDVPVGVMLQKVPNARQALAYLADQFYDHPSKKVTLIGITGTNGKTTTSYLIESILKVAGHKVAVIGTINSGLTTPESLDLQKMLAEMVEQGITHVVMEVSSHALALERVYGCDFDLAIFTNLSHDHLDFHKTREEYLAVKRKLFTNLKRSGLAIINVDDPAATSIMSVVAGEVITYGLDQAKHELRSTKHNEFDAKVADLHIRSDEMTLKINALELRTKLIGLPNVYNIVAAFQAALALKIPQRTIKKGLEALTSVPGRFERIDCGQPFSVIVDFAHSPDALEKLLMTFRPLTEGKLILVFGCPGDRDKAKRPMMAELAAKLADHVIVTTDDPHSEKPENIINDIVGNPKSKPKKPKQIQNPKFKIQVDRKKAIEQALKLAKPGDTVLIAGRGHEQYQDFNGQKISLDDREIATTALKADTY